MIIKNEVERKDIQKVGFMVTIVNVVLIIINYHVQEADKLTKTDMCTLWFNGISKTVTLSGLTFEQMISEIERYEMERW